SNNGFLALYHPQNKAKDNQLKVACVGDSITYGHGIKNWKNNNYPAVLGDMLGGGYAVNNYGSSGKAAQDDADQPYINEKVYSQSLEYEPDIVVIMLGSNDSKPENWHGREQFTADYEKLIKSYQELDSNPEIYIVLPPPAFEVNGQVGYDIDADVIENEIIPAIKDIAKDMNIECIDNHTPFKSRSDLFSDGVHPNAEGARIFATTVYNKISK
ncbi:MAG: GDSL-type esterase/lipase family protein, partial [Eubacterium sp.]